MNKYQYLTSIVAEGNSKTFFIILAFIICVVALYIYFRFFATGGEEYIEVESEDENGEPELGNIEDDDEYEIAADAFDEWMDTLELEDSDEE